MTSCSSSSALKSAFCTVAANVFYMLPLRLYSFLVALYFLQLSSGLISELFATRLVVVGHFFSNGLLRCLGSLL
uniref:Uncharacterized protein n=1 Tax=Arundo donax TaxID=35708 RepID=A0A0A8YZ26_ARUDO